MKKIVSLLVIISIIFCITSYSLAAEGYSFTLQYTGTVVKDEEKSAEVLLVGKNGTLYPKVRIKIDIEGPGKPKIMATDSNNIQHNIAEIGYWGPAEGFAVQGDFTNTTPIKATFPEAGKYVITLSLIDLANSNSVITQNKFEINVTDNQVQEGVGNNIIDNEIAVEELPKTGKNIFEYLTYVVGIGVVFGVLCICSKKLLNK